MQPVTYFGQNRLITTCKNKQLMVFSCNDRTVGSHLLLFGEHEPYVESMLRAMAKEDWKHILIAGSNIGYYDVMLAHVCGDKITVHSFEPNPYCWDFYLTNIELNGMLGRTILNRAALSDKPGMATLNILTNHPGSSTLVGDFKRDPIEVQREKTQTSVVLTTIDDYFGPNPPHLNLIKADIEGSELSMIRGGWNLISNDPPDHIVLEYNKPYHTPEFSTMLDDLTSLGYAINCMLGGGEILPLERCDLLSHAYAEIFCSIV